MNGLLQARATQVPRTQGATALAQLLNLSLHVHKGDPKRHSPGPPAAGEPGAGRQGALQRAGPTAPQSTVWEAAGRSTEASVDAHTGTAGATPSAPSPTTFPDHDPRQSGAEAPLSLFPAEVQDPECLPPSETASPRPRQLLEEESRAPVSERLSRWGNTDGRGSRIWTGEGPILSCFMPSCQNDQNNRMISVRFQGKPFSITVNQVYAPTGNAEEAERFHEEL